MSVRDLASQLQSEIDARALAAVRAKQSTYDWRVVSSVIDPTIAGRGGTATVTDGRGNATFGWRWLERRPVVGDVVLVEIPPPGGTRRIVAIDREIVDPPSTVDLNLPIYTAQSFGAVGDGSTDDTAALNTALATIGESGGGILLGTPGGTHVVTAAISLSASLVRFDLNGSTLLRTGSSTDPVVWIKTKAGDEYAPDGDPNKIRQSGISNGTIDGGGVATYALRISSASFLRVEELSIQGGTTWQIYIDCQPVRPAGGDARDTQNCALRDLKLFASGSQGGMKLTSYNDAAGANTSLNKLDNILVSHTNGVAFYFQNCDGNIASHLRTFRAAGGAGDGLVLAGSTFGGGGHARHNQFFGVQIANGGAIHSLTNTQNPGPNFIFGVSTGNGGGAPTIDGSATDLLWIADDGTGNYGTGGPPSGAAGGDLGGTYPNPTVLQASTTFGFSGAAVTDTSVGNIVDLAITSSRYRWNGASAATLCGIAGAVAGRLVILYNATAAQTLTLAHQSGTEATATNRIVCPGGIDMALNTGETVWLLYETGANRWRVMFRRIGVSEVDSLFDATAPAAIGTAAAGSSTTAGHRDHVHATGAGTPSTQAFGDAAAVGTGPAASMTDHKHAMMANPVSYAAPSLTLGTSNAAGAAATLIRSDATLLAFDATAPAAVGTAAVGAATVAARRDHVHATGAGTPSTQAFGDAAATGTGPAASMTDHKHAMPSLGTGSTNAAAGNDSRFPTSGEKTWLTNGLAGQVQFPATQSASSDANNLDDYEEGTFTPALAYATVGSSTWAATIQTGFYTKIGQRVLIHGTYSGVPTNGTGAGNLQLTGLPFTSQNTANAGNSFVSQFQGYTKASFTQITMNNAINSTNCTFQAGGTAQSLTALAVGDIPTGGTVIVRFSGHYFV